MTEVEAPTRDGIRKRGPYLDDSSEDTILFVPDMDSETWADTLQADGFMRLDDNLWFDDAGINPTWRLMHWRTAYDDRFPGVRKIHVSAELQDQAKAQRESALPIQRPYGASRMWK